MPPQPPEQPAIVSTAGGATDPRTGRQTQPGRARELASAVAAQPSPEVELQDLHAHYGSFHAVRGLDLRFAANEVTAIIGPSGCGKSTLVRCVNRMHEEVAGARATGAVILDGQDVYAPEVDVTAVRRLIGMVFQRATPFPTMSIFNNVAAGLRIAGALRGDALRDRVHRSLQAVGLWDEVKDRLDRPGHSLSGGQQQRLCIARAIAVEPSVILMDEPCSALDPLATMRVEELLGVLKERYTIVIVTHNMQQALRVSDTTAFMLDGELVEHAPTAQLFNNPGDERTQRYITGQFG